LPNREGETQKPLFVNWLKQYLDLLDSRRFRRKPQSNARQPEAWIPAFRGDDSTPHHTTAAERRSILEGLFRNEVFKYNSDQGNRRVDLA
jgi:hypothetical protein